MQRQRRHVIGYVFSFLLGLLGAGIAASYAASVQWDNGEGGPNTISPAVWNDVQTAINGAGLGAGARGTVKLEGHFKRSAADATAGDLKITNVAITLSGGWDPTFTSQSGKSVLDVSGANSANNLFRVLTIGTTNVVVDSVVATNGYLSAASGAGISVANCSGVTVQNSTVSYGTAISGGSAGGIYIGYASAVRVSNCEIATNSCAGEGGGVYILRCRAGIVLEDCTIKNNRAVNGGGVSFLQDSGNPLSTALVARCRLVGNRVTGSGGAFRASTWDPPCRCDLFGCLIADNCPTVAGVGGTAVWNATDHQTRLANCTVADNTNPAFPAQYGMYTGGGSWGMYSRLSLINSILANNGKGLYDGRRTGGWSGAGGHFDFLRSTVKETEYYEADGGPNGYESTAGSDESAPTLARALALSLPGYHSLTDAGVVSQAAEQNIDGDPSFAGIGSEPYQISLASNSRDNGLTRYTNGFYYVDMDYNNRYDAMYDVVVGGTAPSAASNHVYTTDLRGNPRMAGGGIDRGAYELRPPGGLMTMFR